MAEIPDLGSAARAERAQQEAMEAAAKAVTQLPDDMLYVNDMNIGVTTDGQVLMMLRYAAQEGVIKSLDVILPLGLFVAKIANPARQVAEQASQNLVAYAEPFARALADRGPSPEDVAAARRNAAGDGG